MKETLKTIGVFVGILLFTLVGSAWGVYISPYLHGVTWHWKYLLHHDCLLIAYNNQIFFPHLLVSLVFTIFVKVFLMKD